MADQVKDTLDEVNDTKPDKNDNEKNDRSSKTEPIDKTLKKGSRKVKARQKKKKNDGGRNEDKTNAENAKTDADAAKTIDKLNKELADALQDNLELRDKYMRTLAEFDNFKKRGLRDVERSIELQSERLLLNFLPLADDLERALRHGEEEKDLEKLLDGFRRVSSRYYQVLKGFEVEPFQSVGENFDPDRHDALMTRVDEDKDEDTVLEEFEKGFVRGDKVLRHAKVIVSKKD